MSIPTRNYIYGLSPLKRENPARGQSEWYYFDPRNASTFSDFKQIDVPSQNTPNPYAKEIQNYIFKTDSDNYKLLYGNAQPPQENQQNQPQQPENNTAKPIFSNQQNNQIFSQSQNAVGQAIGNNVEQSSQASVQNLNGTIKSTMPQATANAQNMNYIEQIKNILGDGGKDTQSILGTLPNIDNARSYTTDDGGRQLNRNYLQELAEKRKNNNNEINYSLYGEDFDKNFINELVKDKEFNAILNNYIIPNEGGYVNDKNDSGGETNMGISKKTYGSEDIGKLTRERANAIYYKNYYKFNGLNKLPYPVKGFVVDFGVVSHPQKAIEAVHKILGNPPKSDIIGPVTLEKFGNFTDEDYKTFLNDYKNYMIDYFNAVANANPKNKKYLKGWLNRANRAHLDKL